MGNKTSETKLNSKKIRCLQSAFNSIEQRHDAERLTIREQIVRQKEDWLRTQQKLKPEQYNWLWKFFFEGEDVERTVDRQETILNQFLPILVMLKDALNSDKYTWLNCDRKIAEEILKLFS
jgi:hypothetical protein